MTIKKLSINAKDEFQFPKHPDLAPKHGTFYNHIAIGSRGTGKTRLTLEMMDNLLPYYDKFYIISLQQFAV